MGLNKIERSQTLLAQASELGDALKAYAETEDGRANTAMALLLGTLIRNQTVLTQTVVELMHDQST